MEEHDTKRFLLLHGAKKNRGDLLISERAQSLLRSIRPEVEVIAEESWKSLDHRLDEINELDALVIAGGPGIRNGIYPHVYPLIKNLDQLTTPIFTLGSGWMAFPGDDMSLYTYRFDRKSRRLLERVKAFGVRDYLTQRILKRAGFSNVSMNGDPAWYHLPSIGKPVQTPEELGNVVFTPAHLPLFQKQSMEMMHLMAEGYPTSSITCSFHRGLGKGDLVPTRDARNTEALADVAHDLGMKVVDTSVDQTPIDFYDDCDIHIGYRLHAHLWFLSKRKPSFLLFEDSRGRGASEALGLPGVPAWRRSAVSTLADSIAVPKVSGAISMMAGPLEVNPHAAASMMDLVSEEVESGFPRFRGTHLTLDRQFETMRRFIRKVLP